MKNCRRHTGTLEIIKRMDNSINGNPRYMLKVDGWTCYTAPDSMYGYSVTNHDGKQVEAIIGTYYGKPTIDQLRGV